MKAAVCLLGLGLILCGMSATAKEDATRQIYVNIQPQVLTTALVDWGQQTGLQLLVFPAAAVTNNLPTEGLVGTFTPHAALTVLLNDTPFTFHVVNERTVSIRERPALSPTSLRLAQLDKVSTATPLPAARNGRSEGRRAPYVEEVIVTARKRAENVQDVPISIAVLGADEIDRRGLVNAEDYLRSVPGTNQVDTYGGQVLVIRGIETSTENQNFFTGGTAATYFGETPTTSSAGLGGGSSVDLKLIDIERVEVLRGPQGTAFGNASLGGAVRTIPMAPRLESFEGKVSAGFSGTADSGGNNHNVQAVANIPLVADRFAVRAVGYRYEDAGYYRNVAGSNTAFQSSVVTRFGAQTFAINENEVGTAVATGGRIAALFQATDDLSLTLSYLTQKTERDGIPLATVGTYDQATLQVAPEHVVRGETSGVFDTDIDLGNAVIEYDFGWATLLGTYSRIESSSIRSVPYTAVPVAWAASTKTDSQHREDVGEFRFTTQLDGAWNFLAGVYIEDIEDNYLNDYLWYGDPATNPLGPGQRALGVYPDIRSLKQKSAFGEVSWEFVRGLTLTGGVRAYEYDRTFSVHATGRPFFGADGIHRDEDTEASGENFRLNLSYKLTDEAMAYVGWSEGFRLGQLQPGLPPGTCDINADGVVDGTGIAIGSTRELHSDEVNSYEVGGKFGLFDRRLVLDAAVFRMKWTGMPVNIRPGTTPCTFAYLANAGEALSEGVEFQAMFQMTDALRLDLGGSWIDARLTEAVPAIGATRDDRLPGSPEVNANLGLQYAFQVAGYDTFLRADSIYVGDFYGNLQGTPTTKAGDYMKVDTSARMEIGQLSVDLFVRNLTNENEFTYRGPTGSGQFFGYRMRPRTIGVQLGYSF